MAVTQAGTPKFMSPEIFRGKQSYGLQADIWSLGICFYHMITLHLDMTPYLEVYMNPNFHADIEKKIIDLGYTEHIATLTVECLATDPMLRPTSEELSLRLSKLCVEGDSAYIKKYQQRRLEFDQLFEAVTNPPTGANSLQHIYDTIKYRDMLYATKDHPDQMSIIIEEARYFQVLRICLEQNYHSNNIVSSLYAVSYNVLGKNLDLAKPFIREFIQGGSDSLVSLMKNHPDPDTNARGTDVVHMLIVYCRMCDKEFATVATELLNM